MAVCAGDGERVLGGLELNVLELDEFTLSFWLLVAQQGCGREPRVLVAAIQWLARERPRGRLWAAADSRNRTAVAALRKCGFADAGRERPAGWYEADGWVFRRALSQGR